MIVSSVKHTPTFLQSTLSSALPSQAPEQQPESSLPPLPPPPSVNQAQTPNTIYCVTFSSDGSFFACCGEDGRTTLHISSTTDTIAEFFCRDDIIDDDLVDENLDLSEPWFQQRGYMHSFNLKLSTRSCAFTNDSSLLLTGGESETLDIYELTDLISDLPEPGSGKVKTFTSPRLRDHSHQCWITEIQSFVPKGYKKPLNYDPNASDIFATADVRGKVAIWRISLTRDRKKISLSTLWVLRTHVSLVSSLSFSEDCESIITSGIDGKVAVWNVSSQLFSNAETFTPKQGRPFSTTLSSQPPQNPRISLGGHRGGVKMAALATTGSLSPITAPNAPIEEDLKTTLMLTCGTDQQLLLYFIPSPVEGVIKLASHDRSPWATVKRDTIREVIFSPSFNYMATFGIGCDVMLWDAKVGRLILNLIGHQRNIRSVEFATETEMVLLLVSGDEEGKTILWNLTAERHHGTPSSPPSPPSNPPPPDDDDDYPSSFQHPPEDLLISWHHHRVPIRSVRFCGGPTKVVSCDAVGKVIIVDALSRDVLVEFTGGEVSCSPWNFWWRGYTPSTTSTLTDTISSLPGASTSGVNNVFLVTTSLSKMVIWDCESGKTASHRDIPEDTGFIECYDVSTDTSNRQLLSVACCTNSGRAFCWTPDKIVITPEDDEEDDEDKEKSTESSIHNVVDLTALVPSSTENMKNGFRGISFGPKNEIVAWGVHKIFLWTKSSNNPNDYAFHGEFSAGESIYGVVTAKVVGNGVIQCMLEAGWGYSTNYLKL